MIPIKIIIVVFLLTTTGFIAQVITDNPVFAFMTSVISAMGGFLVWLVKSIIKITKEISQVTTSVTKAVNDNSNSLREHSRAIQEILILKTYKK